ncbi:hypothetical protein [Frankia sp. CIT1]|uniref:hypothetical protein n=1 Tax=Frankia sp. CIT1 TaxID=2880974 RepID=UPI001EF44A66|nr:hypothetical protein [Frankia sp. CIT1]
MDDPVGRRPAAGRGPAEEGHIETVGRIDYKPRRYGHPREHPPNDSDGTRAIRYVPARPRLEGLVDLSRPRAEDGREPMVRRGRRQRGTGHAGGRSKALWTLGDQVLSSATNALIAFTVARQVSAGQFGAFSIAFALFALIIGFSRAASTAPMGMKYADASPGIFRAATAAATGTALVLGIIAGGCLVAVGTVLGATVGLTVVAMGLVMPGLLLQDAWRYVFIAQGKPVKAAVNDAVWTVIQLGGVFVLCQHGVHSSATFVLVWGAAAAVAAVGGAVQAGCRPAPRRSREWITCHREAAGYLSAEYITVQGAQQGSTLLIGVFGTELAVGALRGVQTLLGPTTILAVGIISFAVPEFSRRREMPARARMRSATMLSCLVVGAGVLWGVLFLFVPDRVGIALLGDTWAQTRGILGLTIIQQAGAAATVGPACMLYALGQPKITFRVHCVLAPALFVFPVAGLACWDLRGAVVGYIAAFWLTVPLWFVLLRRAAYQAEASSRGRAGSPSGAVAPATAQHPGKADDLLGDSSAGRHRRGGRRMRQIS